MEEFTNHCSEETDRLPKAGSLEITKPQAEGWEWEGQDPSVMGENLSGELAGCTILTQQSSISTSRQQRTFGQIHGLATSPVLNYLLVFLHK